MLTQSTEKYQQILQTARQLYESEPDWVTFFREVLGVDGVVRRTYQLNRSYAGLYIPRMVWREIDNFSSGSVCMVLASKVFDEGDYIRDPDEFRRVSRPERAG